MIKDYKCPRMARAWRNRSPVTQWEWVAHARGILGPEASLQAIWHFAACLYVACGPDDFDSATADWERIKVKVVEYLFNKPTKAMLCGEYSANKRTDQTTPAV